MVRHGTTIVVRSVSTKRSVIVLVIRVSIASLVLIAVLILVVALIIFIMRVLPPILSVWRILMILI